ncbi:MAG: futalosine hydrolase [Nannocystaceae bacterium]|nr:futalosine hydrolase [Nannocystaceae bacterium]
MNILWAYAHPKEAQGLELSQSVQLGVGKVEATLALTRRLAAGRPDVVLNFGVAGVFPGSGLEVGDVCLVTQETFADEGVVSEAGFEDLVSLKLAERVLWSADKVWTQRVAGLLSDVPQVRGTTVSTISGTDALAQAYADRVHAEVETMEGAAVARVCEAFGVPWVQVRSISNRVGDRARGGWDIGLAKTRLHAAVRLLALLG